MNHDGPDYRAFAAAVQSQTGPLRAGGVVAIGNFDGVHRGHQALLAEGRALAGVMGVPLVVLTFAPHPRRFFRPDQAPFLLQDTVQKEQALRMAGADHVVTLAFDARLAALSAVDFIDHILRAGLQARHIVVGHNFVFGHGRGGDVTLLQACGLREGFGVTAMPPVVDPDGTRIASQQVRGVLEAGDMITATALLGRPWAVRGVVITGDQRGRTIGFPTANIALGDYIRPRFGVYAAHVTNETTGTRHRAVVNIGQRPTVDGVRPPLLEAHLLDFQGDLYGHILSVGLVGFMRGEQKFAGLEALKTQIAADCKAAEKLL